MTDIAYEYDVAFSFLAQDEPLATELNDLLQERLKTFLYSKRQGELAGTDGEQTFNAVFGEKARVVVVLYRPGWGETPWTRIEETAIRNRAFESGYDFVKFIPLDEHPSVPKWLPRTQLWLGLKRWGVAGTASVIEARVEECGGEPHEESVQERAARLERSLTFNERRRRFLGSDEGVRTANQEFEQFEKEFKVLIDGIKDSGVSLSFAVKRSGRQIVILGLNMGFNLTFRQRYTNSLTEAALIFSVYDDNPPFSGTTTFGSSIRLCEMKFTFDITPADDRIWVASSGEGQRFSTKDLSSFLLKSFMDEGQKNKF